MSNAKKYFWLKLKENFFRDKEIKKLRKIAGGDTYTIIYLKLQLLSLKNEGKLFFDNLEDSFVEEMALELDESTENVKVTLMYLQKCGLIEEVAKDEFMLPQTMKCIGSETQGAERMRKCRENKQALLSDTHVTNSDTEKEKEKEKELQLQLDKEDPCSSSFKNKDLYKFYEQCGFGFLNITLTDMIDADIEVYTKEWVIGAMNEAVRQNKYKYSYVEGVLRNWKANGRENKNGGIKQNNESGSAADYDFSKYTG